MASSLPDLAGVGVLTRMYPPWLVDEVVAQCGRTEKRRRLLPARLVVYFLLAMALFSPAPYLEVMRHLSEGLRWAGLWGSWHPPSKAAIFRARGRLGAEPMAALFARSARPLGTPAMPGVFWRGWRLMAIDGTRFDVADSAANAAAFGRPGTGRGEGTGGYPQVHALRALIAEAAVSSPEPVDCDRLSFTTALRAARRTVTILPGAFSP